MKFLFHQKRLGHLQIQRNGFAGLAFILLLIVLLQTVLLFFKKEKIIISPPELTQSYWVEGDRFSNSYLEEMALFFTHLMLDVSEANILPQGEILLRYVSSNAYGAFKTKLLGDEKRLKSQQLSLQFTPHSVELIEPMQADITGSLSSYVGSQKISNSQETYRVSFSQHKGRLFLESFELIKSDKEQPDESIS